MSLSGLKHHTQILEGLRILDRRLGDFVRGLGSSKIERPIEADLQGFAAVFVSEAEVLALLNEPLTDPAAVDFTLTHVNLLRDFSVRLRLSDFEMGVILLALSVEVDRKYERIFAFLNNDLNRKRPSLGLAMDILQSVRHEEAWRSFSETGALRRLALIDIQQDDGPRSNWQFRLTEGGLLRLLGNGRLLPELSPFGCGVPALEENEDSVALLACKSKSLVVTGPIGLEKSIAIASLARSKAMSLVSLDLSRLVHAPLDTVKAVCKGLVRDSLLFPSLLHLVTSTFGHLSFLLCQDSRPNVHHDANNSGTLGAAEWDSLYEIRQMLSSVSNETIVVVETEVPFETTADLAYKQSHYQVVDFPLPNEMIRAGLWASVLRNVDPLNENLAGPLSRSFRLSRNQIMIAAHHAQWTGGDAEMYWRAAASIASSGLSGIADRITPKADWKDLVLGETEMAQLYDLVRRVRHRELVVREWGFERRLSYGTGVNALFAGPPGTGKTMAAEVIASELRVPLFRIDCASVISKYIGETEKNLERIFNAAKQCDVVLFFDEADALFGKRTQVSDAHDRYANIETSYLLQRIERHEGIVVLATNLMSNIDNAFIRRLTQIVHFKAPDAAARERIWKKIWPAELPLSADLNEQIPNIARHYDLNGGAIKNAALTAAYLAADSADSHLVQVEHVVCAIAQEYRKLGRSCDSFEWSSSSKTQGRRNGVCT